MVFISRILFSIDLWRRFNFDLTGWTVEEITNNKITSFKISIPVCFIIPNIGDNISFVNNVIVSFGYYNIASSQE